jgi:tRNA pseudouridine38-40 synthase
MKKTRQRNVKLVIAYDGNDYCGWQRQKHDASVQGEIESCLIRMTNEEIFLHGAGRTDAGVHAEAMTAHFLTTSEIPCNDFQRGLNAMLPGAIRIFSVEDVNPDFHARFSAAGKNYQYSIYTGKIQPPRLRHHSLHVTAVLNLQEITHCLSIIEGTHDFSSFENSGSRDKDTIGGRGAVRTIFRASLVQETPDLLLIEFIGDGFLRNMVRNLVGTLLEVGRGKITSEDFIRILQKKDRNAAGPTAPPHGLTLKRVLYD